MGKIKQGVFGGVLGKIGNLVGATWRGISYMRIKPLSVQNPRTLKQLTQRLKFLTAVKFLRPFRELLKIGYKAFAIRMTSMNAALSFVLRNAIEGEYPDFGIDFAAVKVTRGTLRPATSASCDSLAANVVMVEWEDQSDLQFADPNDQPMVVVYCPELDDTQYRIGGSSRKDCIATIELPAIYSGNTVHVWLSFVTLATLVSGSASSSISDSVYAGSVEVA